MYRFPGLATLIYLGQGPWASQTKEAPLRDSGIFGLEGVVPASGRELWWLKPAALELDYGGAGCLLTLGSEWRGSQCGWTERPGKVV